ncbi:hypothetical protein F5Y18DRAFT_98103 [Xylariaceae sp. FL1019]|nr:hypothetical protein F5Y18DRAFT_98103 [Xylariaceae sp. FL1019]
MNLIPVEDVSSFALLAMPLANVQVSFGLYVILLKSDLGQLWETYRIGAAEFTIPTHVMGPPQHWHKMNDETCLVMRCMELFYAPDAKIIAARIGNYGAYKSDAFSLCNLCSSKHMQHMNKQPLRDF